MRVASTRVFGILAGGLFLAGATATTASAQALQSTDRVFAGVSFGSQTKARTFTGSGSFPLYDETATFESTVGIGGAQIIDVNAGIRVRGNLAVGVGYTLYKDTSTGTLTASIPDPLLFDSPHSASTAVTGLEHQQGQIHLSAYWLQPLTDKMDLSVYAGPTFFSVKQDLVTGFAVPSGGVTIGSVTKESVDESAVGYHAGLDLRYLVIKNVGVGVFARYSAGKVNTDSLDAGKMDVGGLQYGGGVRFRF